MKILLLLILFLTLINATSFSQAKNRTFSFSKRAIGEIILRDSIQKIHYKLLDTSSNKDYLLNKYEITTGCEINVFHKNSSLILGFETCCENVILENGIHVGSKLFDVTKFDTTFTLALGEEFGFIKYDKENSCRILLLLGKECMEQFWDSYNRNPHQARMENYLDRNWTIKKIKVISLGLAINN